MKENNSSREQVENELAEIAAELTALSDMIPGLFLIEDMEPATPRGVKTLITDICQRIEYLRKYVGKYF